jgi:septum formation protein
MAPKREPLILASASVARAALLRSAGVEFVIEPADVDEAVPKRAARQRGNSAMQCAAALAAAKALTVSRKHPGALVIGADQILAIDAEWFDKPLDMVQAADQLRRLCGRTHILATAVCVCSDETTVWRGQSCPELTMRAFSPAFLDEYLAAECEAVLGSVGSYRLEGRGVQLFERIVGDYFSILGLPLIELLGFLRERGTVST